MGWFFGGGFFVLWVNGCIGAVLTPRNLLSALICAISLTCLLGVEIHFAWCITLLLVCIYIVVCLYNMVSYAPKPVILLLIFILLIVRPVKCLY